MSRPALALKIIPKGFITRVNTSDDKRTLCARGGCRRAHYGRERENLREGNSNPAGKAEWVSGKRTRRRPRATRLSNATATPGRGQQTLPAPAIRFDWQWKEGPVVTERKEKT